LTPAEPIGTINNGDATGRAAHYPGPRGARTPPATAIPKNQPLPIDEARLLPRFRTPNWRTPPPLTDADRPRDWRPGDNSTDTQRPTNPIVSWTAEDLRGIPIVGRGSPGASPGTNPLSALIGKEERAA
jgi:hypothetical protein